jgi:CPA1 family monovalent cation:H+ antiporter
MVLALSLPRDLPLRQLLITMIFAVVIFTLVVQGLSIKMLLEKLGLIRATSLEAYEERKGEIYGLGRAQSELERLYNRGVISQRNYELLAPRLHDRLQELQMGLDDAAANQQEAVAEELHRAEERLLHAEKDGIKDAYLSGIISEGVMKKLLSSIDDRMFSLETATEERGSHSDSDNNEQQI